MFRVVVLLFSIVLFSEAYACTANSTTKTHSLVDIDVPAGAIIGQTLATFGPFSSDGATVNCNYTPYLWLALDSVMSSTNVVGKEEVYKTNVKGVGVQVYSTFNGQTYIGNAPTYWYQSNTGNAFSWITNIYVKFIVIGPLESGVIQLPMPAIKALTSSSQTVVSSDSVVYQRMGFNPVRISVSTCSIQDSEQTVVLPKVAKGDFAGVGTTTGSKTFSIRLNCDAGVSVYASVTDSNQIENQGPNLSLDGTSTASGVGVQLLYSSNPIQFGYANSFHVAGNSSLPATTHSVPFEARYVQTDISISPGSVRSKAVISFDYL